jgi:Uncharacterized protein, possibly involved in aromatic compounds catabolism
MMMNDIPEGFQPLATSGDVLERLAPLYFREQADGLVTLGVRLGQHHCNPRGTCHGGTWATLADVLMGINVGLGTGLNGPTVSMSIDFVGSAVEGQWVEGHGRILRWTSNLAFTECHFMVEGKVALRVSGVFRRKFPPLRTLLDLRTESS